MEHGRDLYSKSVDRQLTSIEAHHGLQLTQCDNQYFVSSNIQINIPRH